MMLVVLVTSCAQAPVQNPSSDNKQIVTGDSATAVLFGSVRKGPIKPVQLIGEDNTAPLAGAKIDVANNKGIHVTTAVSDTLGLFIVPLVPGTYVLTAQRFSNTWPISRTPLQTVTLTGKDTTKVSFDYDTGIR